MKRLIIAEKPSVARELARVLGYKEKGDGYISGKDGVITWALGHLVTLEAPEAYESTWATWSLETLPMLPSKMKTTVIAETRKQYKVVERLLKRQDVTEVVIATDAGREGELVARLIIEKSGVKKPMKRLWISSQTDKAIKEGFNNLKPSKAYDDLYHSALARAEADWLVGLNATRALTCHYNAQLSAGRVQTPTLAAIVRREEAICAFRPKNYYELAFDYQGYHFFWQGEPGSRLFDKEKAKALYERLKQGDFELVELTKKEKRSSVPLLYDLTSLQRDANQRFGFSAKETLRHMQALYEVHKVLTYPRTDSKHLTHDMVATLPERLRAINSGSLKAMSSDILKKNLPIAKPLIDDKKVGDHHAIIPTEVRVSMADLSSDEYKIYDMVAKRFLSAFLGDYIYEETKAKVVCEGEVFTATGKESKSLGYKAIDADDELRKVTVLAKGKLKGVRLTLKQGETKPPSRYTEGTLLSFMENPSEELSQKDKAILKVAGGIGTPATRADIIEKLFSSFYIEHHGNTIVPTKKGEQLIGLVPEALLSAELTASWEEKLEKIAKGELNQKSFDKEIRAFTKKVVSDIKASEKTYRHDNMTRKPCPNCGKFLLLVNGKRGKMHICQDRACGYKETLSTLSNARCPECKKKLEVIKKGEKKRYICSCGFREDFDRFNEKLKAKKGTSKKDAQKCMKQMAKKEEMSNNPFMDALKNLK